MTSILDQIVRTKGQEVQRARAERPLEEWQSRCVDLPAPRGFLRKLQGTSRLAMIAEVKKASPSAGVIRQDFDPVNLAQIYEAAGADCLSVLTDEHYFQGHLDYLAAIAQTTKLPLLRKDFIIEEYQIYEARGHGADAVLLIAEILSDQQLGEFTAIATELGLDCLVEIHDEGNISRVNSGKFPLVGINNRDLRTFKTDLLQSLRLRPLLPESVTVIAESGIHTTEHMRNLAEANLSGVLVGEALMRQADVAEALKQLRNY